MSNAQRPDDMALVQMMMKLDQRTLEIQMRVVQNRAADPRPVVAELDRLCSEYKQLAALGAPTYPFYTVQSLHQKAAQCLRDAGAALALSGDSQGAATRFTGAAESYDAAGQLAEAAKCRDKLRGMQVTAGKGVADEVARLQQWVLAHRAPSDELAENLVSLAELEANLGDIHAAREHFDAALKVIKDLKWPDPSQATAEASLLDLIPMMLQDNLGPGQSDSSLQSMGSVVQVVKSRALHRRIYAGMSRILSDSDPDRADEYDAKIREMAKPMSETSGPMINILAQLGRIAQKPDEGAGEAGRGEGGGAPKKR
jgi:tetratricopeptide (TPR) repeat protein